MGKLFERVLSGDPSAQSEVASILRRIARAVSRRGGPGGAEVDWEDVAQEAARRFFTTGIRQYRGEGSEEGYLFAIVRSTVLQHVRSAERRRRRERDLVRSEPDPPRPPDSGFEIRRILMSLSPECADLLRRVFLEGVSYPELAEELGMLESSVRVRVSRCLRKAMEIAEGDSR